MASAIVPVIDDQTPDRLARIEKEKSEHGTDICPTYNGRSFLYRPSNPLANEGVLRLQDSIFMHFKIISDEWLQMSQIDNTHNMTSGTSSKSDEFVGTYTSYVLLK